MPCEFVASRMCRWVGSPVYECMETKLVGSNAVSLGKPQQNTNEFIASVVALCCWERDTLRMRAEARVPLG